MSHPRRRGILPLAATAVAAGILAAGCGAAPGPPSAAPFSANPTSPPATPVPGGTRSRQPIDSDVTVSGGGRTLTVSAAAQACTGLSLTDGVSAASVTLTVEVTDHHRAGQVCPDHAVLTRLSVRLAAPLGRRQVFDGATGRELTVRG